MKLVIPADIERKLDTYVQEVDGEIAGMGKVEVRDDGNLYVLDIAIYDQEVTAGTADLSPEALAKFQTDLIKRGESPKQWYLWWHSHNTFGAFFSGTDTATIASSTEFDHLVSLVVNKKRERMCRVDTHRPFRLVLDKVQVEIQPHINPRTVEIEDEIGKLMEELSNIKPEIPGGEEAIKAEVAAKVKHKNRWGAGMGFGKHGQGSKGHTGDRSYLDLDLDESWSKKRKKGGGVTTTARELIASRADRDEIEIVIEQTTKLVMAHMANGNAETPECDALRADLASFHRLLRDLDNGDYDDDEYYWNTQRWIQVPVYTTDDEYHSLESLLPLTPPYKYGFSKDDDDPRIKDF